MIRYFRRFGFFSLVGAGFFLWGRNFFCGFLFWGRFFSAVEKNDEKMVVVRGNCFAGRELSGRRRWICYLYLTVDVLILR